MTLEVVPGLMFVVVGGTVVELGAWEVVGEILVVDDDCVDEDDDVVTTTSGVVVVVVVEVVVAVVVVLVGVVVVVVDVDDALVPGAPVVLGCDDCVGSGFGADVDTGTVEVPTIAIK